MERREENFEARIENNADDTSDWEYETIMAVDVKDRGTIGCCHYIAQEEKLCLFSEMIHGDEEIVDSCSDFSSRIMTTVFDNRCSENTDPANGHLDIHQGQREYRKTLGVKCQKLLR